MAPRTFPGLGLTGGWDTAESGWGSAMNTNLRNLSAFVHLSVIDIVTIAGLPGSPTNGMIYIVTDDTPANAIRIRDNGAWVTLPPIDGMRAFRQSNNMEYVYYGANWNPKSNDIPSYTISAAGLFLRVNVTGDGLEWIETPAVPGYEIGDLGKVLKVAAGPSLAWATDDTGLPAYGAPQALMALRVASDGTSLEWFTVGGILPSYGAPEAGKVLKVAAGGASLEWATDDTGTEVPAFGAPEAGKVLKVATGGASMEWATDEGALPAFAGNAGKYLKVSAGEAGTEWGSPVPDSSAHEGKVLEALAGGTYGWRRPGRVDVVTVTDANKSLVAAEIGAFIRMVSATARNVNVPLEATESMAIGSTFIVRQGGAGQITLVPESGVTLRTVSTLKTRIQESTITLTKTTTNGWDISGDLAAT